MVSAPVVAPPVIHGSGPVAGRAVRAVAWASLAAQVLIMGTGAAVRLTGSGLGCPTWPRCTDDSFTTTPAMGAHGVIEFGNRLLTFALVVVALAAIVAVWRLRRRRRDLFALAVVQLASIPAQAVLGGLTVWSGLNPWLVAAHFVFSLALVTAMTVFVHRARTVPGPRALAVPGWSAALTVAAAGAAAVVLVLGTVTTGAGPHAGDPDSPRNGLDPVAVAGVHEAAAWTLFLLTLVVVVSAVRLGLRPARAALALLGVEVLQITVGVTQVALGWAAGVVIVHVFLAACLTAATTALLLSLRAPALYPASASGGPAALRPAG